MKVLHLISGGDTGGARTHVHLLLKHLNRDIRAELVCFMDGPFAQDAAAMGIPTRILEKNPLAALRSLRALAAKEHYDVIHCHGARGNLMGALLRPFVAAPVLTTIHSDPRLDYLGRTAARLSYGTLNALALRRMDYYVGVSDAMRELMISRGLPASRFFTIYNGVEFPAPEQSPDFDRTAYLRGLGLNYQPGDLVVGIAARLHPVKDLPTLLRGFAAAWAEFPRLRLVIAGDGQDRESLGALAQELGIAEAVCFAGWLNGMARFYHALDINVLTSLSETFPYALTEGAREHLPTISSRVGGIPALIAHGETGLLFEAGDAPALGEQLRALAASEPLRRKLGEALYEKANAFFSAEATARQQIGIYRSILRRWVPRKGRAGVLICGAYGMHNLGDDAVLRAMVAELRRSDPELPITVLSRSPKETMQELEVSALHMFDAPHFLRVMRHRRLYINGGGSLIQDVTSTRSLWYYLYTLGAAKHRGCRVMMYGCGIGPVKRGFNRRLSGWAIDRWVDGITLRGGHSAWELAEFGVRRPTIEVAADPALFLPPAEPAAVDAAMAALGLEPGGAYLGLCVRRWPGMDEKAALFAAAADYAWETYGLRPVLLAVNSDQDQEITEQVRRQIHVPCAEAVGQLPMQVMVGIIGRLRAVMAMRLHALIFAASQSVPLAAVSYDPKVASFLEDLGESNAVDYAALTDKAQLCKLVDAAVTADRAALERATGQIMEQESRNVQMAYRLMESEDAKR